MRVGFRKMHGIGAVPKEFIAVYLVGFLVFFGGLVIFQVREFLARKHGKKTQGSLADNKMSDQTITG